MSELPRRVRAVVEADLAYMREYSGLHEYDGVVQDLSPDGVRRSLARFGGADGSNPQEGLEDPLDLAAVEASERALSVRLGTLELYRSDPLVHTEGLDLACYERDYAPEDERERARRRHLAQWPEAVGAAVESLDRVPPAVAALGQRVARGLAAAVRPEDGKQGEVALAALERLVEHLGSAASSEGATGVLGAARLVELLTCGDGIALELDELVSSAAKEKERMRQLLEEACAVLSPGEAVESCARRLMAGHGTFDEVLSEAQLVVSSAQQFVIERQLVPFTEGECIAAATPPARRWAPARISWSAPWEREAPAYFHITPPDASWSAEASDAWLERFSHAALPVMTVHETFPGHASHAISMRHVGSPTRRTLWSELFFEGWAHYCEEMCLVEGFRDGDPRFQAGVAIEALVRLVRLENAVAIHTGGWDVTEGAHRFERDAFLSGPAATAEATRGLFEPTYVRYALGKLLMLRAGDRARRIWGAGYSRSRFHREVLALGSPPFGIVESALGLSEEEQ